jgi:hypothetical protein
MFRVFYRSLLRVAFVLSLANPFTAVQSVTPFMIQNPVQK